MIPTHPRPWIALASVAILFAAGCARAPSEPPATHEKDKDLPLAYPQNQITDPSVLAVAQAFKTWALAQRAGRDRQAVYQQVEVLPPVQTVQPYGVGAYQQELRLPVILTTGPAWNELNKQDKETQVADAFNEIAGQLSGLKHKPALQPTLTIQTPQGMELGWINHLNANGANLHGD